MVSNLAGAQPDEPMDPIGFVSDQLTALVLDHVTTPDYDSAEVVGRGIEQLARSAGRRVSIGAVKLDAVPPSAEVRIPKHIRDEVEYCAELQVLVGSAVRLIPCIGLLGHTYGRSRFEEERH
jgi:hypothetical protein